MIDVVSAPGGPETKLNWRYPETTAGHGAGMHVTFGIVSRLRLENVCEPEQLLKLWPIVIDVTFSSAEIVNDIGAPCAVVPIHSPR